ncbi:MAG: M23 family metallopeptidase [Bdellovibrionota bacterium]
MTRTMKTTFLCLSSLVLAFAADSRAATDVNATNVGESMDMVICSLNGQPVEIFDHATKVFMKVSSMEPVKVFQGWGENKKNVSLNNTPIPLVRVQLPRFAPTLANGVFVFEGNLAPAAACQKRVNAGFPASSVASGINDAQKYIDELEDEGEEGEEEEGMAEDALPPIVGEVANTVTNIMKGLDSPTCCLMPIEHRPDSFLVGMGRFGWGRRGRIHAGVDLYGRTGQKIRSVSAGQVVRAPYFFKRQTMAVDIRHEGGFIVRYGEITGKSFGLALGTKVTRGQQVGTMAKLSCCEPMLHMEIYSGSKTGALTQKNVGKYHRRSDLVDPTKYIKKWPLK